MNDLLNVESLALMVAQFLCIFPPHPPVFNKPFQGVSHVRTDQMTQNPPPPQAIWPPWWTIQTLFKVTNKTTQSACKIPCQPRIWLVLFLIAIQIHFITLENMWILFIQLNYEFSILTTWNEKKMYWVKNRTIQHAQI